LKKFEDYCGDGVRKCDLADKSINCAAKMLWEKQYTLVQKFIPDSIGKSIRVLCIGGKAYACA